MSESVDGLKQRLVGAFVILSLAIIFLPMIFDKPHREKNTAIEMVPPKPQQRSVVISKPQNIELPAGSETRKIQKEIVPAAMTKEESQVDLPASDSTKGLGVDSPSNNTNTTSSTAAVEQESAPQTTVEAKPSKAPENNAEVYTNVWMVQLGTFSKSENAYRLRDSIREKGIDAHTKTIESGAVRVFAGPFVTKKEALRMKKKLDTSFKVDSLVLFLDT